MVGAGVQFQAVETSLGRPYGNTGPTFDCFIDFLFGHLPGRCFFVNVINGLENNRGCGYLRSDCSVNTAPGAAVVHLHKCGAAVFVNNIGEHVNVLDIFIVIESETAVAGFG